MCTPSITVKVHFYTKLQICLTSPVALNIDINTIHNVLSMACFCVQPLTPLPATLALSPSQFVLLWRVAQMFDQRCHTIGQIPLPARPGVRAEGLIPNGTDGNSETAKNPM